MTGVRAGNRLSAPFKRPASCPSSARSDIDNIYRLDTLNLWCSGNSISGLEIHISYMHHNIQAGAR